MFSLKPGSLTVFSLKPGYQRVTVTKPGYQRGYSHQTRVQWVRVSPNSVQWVRVSPNSVQWVSGVNNPDSGSVVSITRTGGPGGWARYTTVVRTVVAPPITRVHPTTTPRTLDVTTNPLHCSVTHRPVLRMSIFRKTVPNGCFQ